MENLADKFKKKKKKGCVLFLDWAEGGLESWNWYEAVLYFLLRFLPLYCSGLAQKTVDKLPFVPSPSMNWMYVQYICKLVQNE